MATKKQNEQYGNSSISMLKGEDRVRKRPAVIFGSDDLEGCKHAVFEILSNAIDEAREGHGDTIIVTRYEDPSFSNFCTYHVIFPLNCLPVSNGLPIVLEILFFQLRLVNTTFGHALQTAALIAISVNAIILCKARLSFTS